MNNKTVKRQGTSSKGPPLAGSMTSQPFPPPPPSPPHPLIKYANDLINMQIYVNDLLNMQIYVNDRLNRQIT